MVATPGSQINQSVEAVRVGMVPLTGATGSVETFRAQRIQRGVDTSAVADGPIGPQMPNPIDIHPRTQPAAGMHLPVICLGVVGARCRFDLRRHMTQLGHPCTPRRQRHQPLGRSPIHLGSVTNHPRLLRGQLARRRGCRHLRMLTQRPTQLQIPSSSARTLTGPPSMPSRRSPTRRRPPATHPRHPSPRQRHQRRRHPPDHLRMTHHRLRVTCRQTLGVETPPVVDHRRRKHLQPVTHHSTPSPGPEHLVASPRPAIPPIPAVTPTTKGTCVRDHTRRQ